MSKPKTEVWPPCWDAAVKDSADPARAAHYAKQLFPLLPGEYTGQLSPEQARVLAALFSGSRALSELLLTHPDWVHVIDAEKLTNPRQKQGLRKEAAAFLEPALKSGDYSTALSALHIFKQREMLRIGARDLARTGAVPQIIEEISNVADVCIQTVTDLSLRRLMASHGIPHTREATGKWEKSEFCVMGMGKHGGQELNYSSDIDVLFVYSGEGEVFKSAPKKGVKPTMANHQFYARLSEAIIAECTRMTAEGFLFRIDLRLRPEGKTAPLARSLSSYENYYSQWGQTWERMMLIKARCVGGDESLGAEFLEMVQPFRYPRSISSEIPREVAAMKQRIENEVVRSGELERNVKLGRGGIREIEFVAQTLQVLNAGKQPFLQGARTIPALEKLRDYGLMEATQVGELKSAYCFLRDIEHRLQMEDNRQTHSMPVSPDARLRLARLMGFATTAAFEKKLDEHRANVRQTYDKFIKLDDPAREHLPHEVAENADQWARVLREHSFRDPERCVKLVQEFVQGAGVGHVSSRTLENAITLLKVLLDLCPVSERRGPEPEFLLSDPDRVLARLDSYVAKYGARSMLFEAWVSNTSLFRLLLLAFDRSEFLAELAVRDPGLIDEIEQSGQLRRRKTQEQILDDLRHGFEDPDQRLWLRRYYHAEQMRIGLRDILNLARPEQTQEEISALADAFLAYGLEVVARKHKWRKPLFAIIGMGKLGGRELIYASDLDVLFVAEDKTSNLPALQKAAVDFIELLSARTEQGATFATDARLRPDGEKGLLVNTASAYADYYKRRAMLWEIQSLSRFRPITGNTAVRKQFEKMARSITDFSDEKSARFPNWKREIHAMRMRIEKERTPAGKVRLAIKTGAGGLMDVEFVAQALCLQNGWHEPNTLNAIRRAAAEKALPGSSAQILIDNYHKLIEIERILRRWSFEPESVLPADPAPFYRVAVRCGFSKPEDFQTAVDAYRAAIRKEYDKFFKPENLPRPGKEI